MSSARRVGLPETLRMRHDSHFVDRLSHPGGTPLGRLIPVEEIDPNSNQPRQSLGDLSELTASIREKGILEPILVRPRDGRFQIIAGERRYRAAWKWAWTSCPQSGVRRRGVSRSPLVTFKHDRIFEEADGLRTPREVRVHHEVMRRAGRAEPSRYALDGHDAERVRQLWRWRHFSILVAPSVRKPHRENGGAWSGQKAERDTEEARRLTRDARRKPSRGRPRHYVFNYTPSDKTYAVAVRFKKSQVPREELVRALQAIIEDLMREES